MARIVLNVKPSTGFAARLLRIAPPSIEQTSKLGILVIAEASGATS